ncbi:MAG TPA: DEAD/DEAH box helicase, partial [Chryseolinea sp.]|nr:DEAD/DEAH box helicase [Chryseolinea sp.]
LADLQMQLKNLFALKSESFVPEINLTVIRSNEFVSAKLNQQDFSNYFKSVEFLPLKNFNTGNKEYDLLLDVSVLQRPGFSDSGFSIKHKNKAVIRTSHHIHTDRNFITADLIKYSPLVNYNPQNPEYSVFNLQTIHALRYFLQTVFRKNTFREGQLEILNKALQMDSVIGLLPTGGGKSLTYQLAALLQPGVCLVIDPIKSLMKDQFTNLQKNHIDACNYINSSLKTREERERETAKLSGGEMLFSFVSPERLQMKTFRDSLLKMHEHKVYFSYCIIDEAHCVSEWGHDFRTSYLSLGKNAIEFCKTKNKESIPLFGLTATASFDVLSDVQRELSGNNEKYRLKEDSVIRFDSVNREELNFDIIDTEIQLSENDDEWKLKRKLGEQKQATLIQELRKQTFDNGSKAGIIFCPHKGWFYGVTDRYKQNARELNGVYDAIKRAQIPNIMMGSFMGSDADDERTKVSIEADSILAQEEFVDGQLNLLVSTKAFGMGIDKPNVRFTFHINYPSSIESFVQEAGRAGRDREKANCYILFNDQKVKTTKKEHEIDRDNLLYFHNSSFKGVEKEKAILLELLTAIHTPNKLFDIEVKAHEHINEEINLALWQSPAGHWYMFVNGETFSDKFGALHLPQLELDTARITKPPDQCNEVLNFIRNYILQNKEGNVFTWLKKSTVVAGIENLLQANEHVELTLRFENNITERTEIISNWLKASFDNNLFDAVTTKEILMSANSFDDFKEQVGSKIRGGLTFDQVSHNRDTTKGNPIGTSEKELQRLFHGFRVKSDTEKALYRLSTVGIIDDYTIDFNSKTYTVTAARKSDEQYYKNLENYIRKYYSEVRTKQEIKKVRKFEGDTVIQKCLFFLTDFVYREIGKKRFEGIGAMKEACQIGKVRGGVAFKEYIDLYFNSKYARIGYEVAGKNKSLTDRTDEGRDQDIKWVWEFIEVTHHDPSGGQINNLKHLRGACVRLLIPQPNNGTLHLLKAFSLFILDPDNNKLMEEASDSFSKGFIELKREHKLSFDLVLNEVEEYKNYVLEFSTHPGIQGIMDKQIELLSVKIHSDWLDTFNDKFLKDYEPRHTYAS